MTDYVDIDLTNLEPGDPLTDTIMQAIVSNLLAVVEGSLTGDVAPRLTEQALDHSPVNRQALKTGTSSVSYSFGSNGGSQTITMDPYSFFPANDGTNAASISHAGSSANLPALRVSSSGAASGTVRWRFIEA